MTDTKKSRIPAFKTIEEEAKFWDTHDTMDFADEFTPVTIQVKKKLDRVLPIRFDSNTLTAIEQKASQKGIGATTLIRMWVLEHLQHMQTA